jgi:hypothetical protein
MLEKGALKGLFNMFGVIVPSIVAGGLLITFASGTILTAGLSVVAAAAIGASIGLVKEHGLRKGISKTIGLIPQLFIVFPAYVPVYAGGAIEGLRGKASFIRTTRGWRLDRFGFMLPDSFTKDVDYDTNIGLRESFWKQIVISLVMVGITVIGLQLWWSFPIIYSWLFISSVMLWGLTPFITDMVGKEYLPSAVIGYTVTSLAALSWFIFVLPLLPFMVVPVSIVAFMVLFSLSPDIAHRLIRRAQSYTQHRKKQSILPPSVSVPAEPQPTAPPAADTGKSASAGQVILPESRTALDERYNTIYTETAAKVTRHEGITETELRSNRDYYTETGEPLTGEAIGAIIEWPKQSEALVASLIGIQAEIQQQIPEGLIIWNEPMPTDALDKGAAGFYTSVFTVKKDYSGVSPQAVLERTAMVEDILIQAETFDITFEGVIVDAKGVILAKGYVDNEELTGVRDGLLDIFPEGHRGDIVHITLGRIDRAASAEEFKILFDAVDTLNSRHIGHATVDSILYGIFQGPVTETYCKEVLADISLTKSSSAGTIKENIEELKKNINNFDKGSENIASIIDRFNDLSQDEFEMARDVLLNVLEAEKDGYKDADMHLRKMAAYSLRLFAEKQVIHLLLTVAISEDARDAVPATEQLPEPIQSKSLSEIAMYSLDMLTAPSENIIADVVYSDGLRESQALRNIILNMDRNRVVYLVDKQGQALTELLSDLGLEQAECQFVVFDARDKEPTQIKTEITAELRKNSISLKDIRVYAVAEEDINLWRESLVDRLIKIMDNERFEIISDLSKEHERFIKIHEQVSTQA